MHRRVDGLDLVRSLAITLVVYQHIALFFFLCYGAPLMGFRAGAIGVTLFFTLSGFLIGGLLLDAGNSLKDSRAMAVFWIRRALRTIPNYYLFIVLNLVFWVWFQRRQGVPNPLPVVPRYLFLLQNLHARSPSFFGESWSLAVEEWFYFLFPLGLFVGLKFMRGSFGRAYWACTLIMLLVPLCLRAVMTAPADWERDVMRVVLFRLDSIALGLAAVALSRRFPEAWRRWRVFAAVIGAALLLECAFAMSRPDLGPSAYDRVLLPMLLPLSCALFFPAASSCAELRPIYLAAPIRCLARWSYSLYLVNLMLSFTVLSHLQFGYGSLVGVTGYIAACLASSALVYTLFEAPILRWRDRHFVRKPATVEAPARPETRA